MSQLLSNLNEVQLQAVTHRDGPLLILAGAGSGKTRIITYRVAYLIEQGVYPHQILAITFTNKAANEMLERINRLLGLVKSDVWIATIHATCARILRREIEKLGMGYTSEFNILDANDQKSLIRRCKKQLKINSRVKESFFLSKFSRLKNSIKSIPPWDEEFDKQYDPKRDKDKVQAMWQAYQKELLKSNSLDFDDLQQYTWQLFRDHEDVLARYQRRWQYQMIDEFQDVNTLQYEIIKKLSAQHRNLCVVGDDDQSIYRWRGADVKNILNFDKDFPDTRVLVLDQNYRSTQTILKAASHISGKISERHEKELWTNNSVGSKITVFIHHNEYGEGRYIVRTIKDLYERDGFNWDQMAILYRTNAQSRVLEEMMIEYQIPYYLVGEIGFYKRREIKDLVSYMKLLVNANDREAFFRIINVPARGLGQKTVERITNYAVRYGISPLEALSDQKFLDSVGARPSKSMNAFVEILTAAREILVEKGISETVKILIQLLDYLEYLRKDDSLQSESRIENVSQLVNATQHFEEQFSAKSNVELLRRFLEKATLASEVDEFEKKSNRVALMTLHCAKGLEFPVVFLAGCVEGLLPHSKSARIGGARLDEERRLCYVGITRAEKNLFITCPLTRRQFGYATSTVPSRFVEEIPDAMKIIIDKADYLKNRAQYLAELGLAAGDYKKVYGSADESFEQRGSIRRADWFTSRFGDEEVKQASHAPQNIPVDSGNGVQQPHHNQGRSQSKAVPAFQMKRVNNQKSGAKKTYRLGTRIRHNRWGEGMVLQVSGSGERLKLLVSFPGAGRKTVLANIAPIEIIEY